MLDTVRHVATPEGGELELRLAGVGTRARAWFYDSLIRLAGWIGLGMAAAFIGRMGLGLFLLGGFLLEWFYPMLFEVYMRGQTPGKRLCRIAVLCEDGRPAGWNEAFLRNTVRFADFLPFFYGLGLFVSLLDRDGRRLGDLAAGTVVVHLPPAAAAAGPADDGATGSEAPGQPLDVEAQQALIEYRLRAPHLTDERSLELAEIPLALTGDVPPATARARLLRIGNFLLGRH